MARLQYMSALAALTGGAAPAIRRPGLDIREAAPAAQFVLAGDLGSTAVLRAVADVTGCHLSADPNRKIGNDPYVVWLAPDKRLLVAAAGDRDALLRDLVGALAGLFASAADVTDGLSMLELAGERLSDLLAMGCALDLDPRSFGADRSARTLFANVPVLLYRHDGGQIRLHTDRSILRYLWTWLEQANGAILPG